MEKQIQQTFTAPTPKNPLFSSLARAALPFLVRKLLPKWVARGVLWLLNLCGY